MMRRRTLSAGSLFFLMRLANATVGLHNDLRPPGMPHGVACPAADKGTAVKVLNCHGVGFYDIFGLNRKFTERGH